MKKFLKIVIRFVVFVGLFALITFVLDKTGLVDGLFEVGRVIAVAIGWILGETIIYLLHRNDKKE